MTLSENIESQMKCALKEGDNIRLSVLRMLVAAVRQVQIDKNIKTIEDAEVLQIIQRQIKQRKDSIDQFIKGNRQDLADKEVLELKVLEGYMPKQLTEDELHSLVKESIAEAGASSKQDTGKVMKIVMEKAKGKCDGKIVSQIVAKLLP